MNLETRALQEFVDHRGPMTFIDELVSVDEDTARCRGTIRADNPFLVDDRLPAWILIEYMAQSVAIFAGHIRTRRGMEHRHGLLLGCRNLRLADVELGIGSRLEIEVVETARFENLGSFSGKVTCDAGDAASGTVSVYETTGWPAPRTGLAPEATP